MGEEPCRHDGVGLEKARAIAHAVEFPIGEFLGEVVKRRRHLDKERPVRALMKHISRMTDEEKLERATNGYRELPESVREWFETVLAPCSEVPGGVGLGRVSSD